MTSSSEHLQIFLLENPTTLSQQEVKDVEVREDMDRVREQEMQKFRDEVEGRVRDLEMHLRKFKQDLVQKGRQNSFVCDL